jgi:uridylate kinase
LLVMNKKIVVISVGGSLIVPDGIDVKFLRDFRSLILNQIKKGTRFVVICGGGKVCRRYQDAARSVVELSDNDLDWIGIHSTRLNAQLMRAIFHGYAEDKIDKDPKTRIRMKKKILIAAGWKPGFSTDYDAVVIAEQLGAKYVINLSNIDYVYTKDPKTHKDAKPITEINWKEFRKLLPTKWSPGLSSPFDPIASRIAQRARMEVAILNGRNIKNLENYLNGNAFTGTKIN